MQWIWCCISFLTLPVGLVSQCAFEFDSQITDLQTSTVEFNVSGLVNDDLAGTQGVCAIQLRFNHSYIGDVTIELVSPAGQSVLLVGAVTDQINPTNLTTWDVRFVQCAFPAAPDAGFSSQWSNNQAWQVFTLYNGTYYPAAGCLEDLNLGSANGIWQIRVTDHDAPQTGTFLGATIVFCDNTGLTCNFCNVDAGTFSDVNMGICEGESVAVQPFYPDTMPDPQFFNYTFMISPDMVNKNFMQSVNTSAMSPGTYQICGISYGVSDSAGLFAALNPMTYIEVRDVLLDQDLGICAEITPVCMTLVIDADSPATMISRQICAGESTEVGGQQFSTAGIHVVSIDLAEGCDSTVILNLSVTNVEAVIVQTDTIGCSNPSTTLDGSGSIAGPGATYAWSTTNGMIVGDSNQPVISIAGNGLYSLTVTYQGCSDVTTHDVISDGTLPFVFFEGGMLTCMQQSFTFNTVVFPTQVTYAWTGPNGFVSNLAEPTVTEPGTYVLEITDGNQCSVSASAIITEEPPVVAEIQNIDVTCDLGRSTLWAEPGGAGFTYFWTFPDGSHGTERYIYAYPDGTYCLRITSPSGCVDSTCFDYVADYTLPAVSATAMPDTIHCNSQAELVATSPEHGVVFTWYDDQGAVLIDQPSFFTSLPGTYIVTADGPNGCSNHDTVVLVPGLDLPVIATFTDTLTCAFDTVSIGAVIPDPMATYLWGGTGLVENNTPIVRVVMPGNYDVEITTQSGCLLYHRIKVFGDFSTVPFLVQLDTLSCIDPVAQVSFSASGPYDAVHWLLPDGTQSTDTAIASPFPGEYQLTLTGPNGCDGTQVYTMPVDTLPPVIFVEAGVIGCTDSVEIQTIRVDSVAAFLWSGPGGFTSTASDPFVHAPGNYLLEVTGVNGCQRTLLVNVESDLVEPDLSVNAELLDCIDSTAVLSMISIDSAVTFAWFSGGVQMGDSAFLAVSEPGFYVGIATGLNGCTSQDTLELLPPEQPDFSVLTDTITCTDPAILQAMSNTSGIVFNWTDSAQEEGTGTEFQTENAGNVLVVVTAPNGCTHDTTVVVGTDTLAPLAVAASNEMVLCDVRTISLDGTASVGDSLLYQWTTVDGVVNAGAQTATPVITGTGTYVLEVTESGNGCTDSDTLLITEGVSALGTVFFSVIPECEGNNAGSVTIDSVVGATTSLTYTLAGESGGPVFEGLSSGEYLLTAVDSFGCATDTLIEITNTSSTHSIQLGPDVDILIGDSVMLDAIVDLAPEEIMGVHWGQPVPCDSCLTNTVAPFETTVYTVFLTDQFGCVAEDAVTIFVEEKAKFFIPNVFSPNGDQVNDEVRIVMHPGVERVLRFSIYDRWGNVVYHREDFDPQDASVFWDGTFEGESMNPAVFAYVLETQILTGRSEIFSGTITLLR